MTTNEANRPSSDHRGSWKELRITFDEALARLPEALQKEGFGIITQIDMQATLKAKLGVDSRPYRILGACSPGFAKKALELDPRVGLLLPCNVVLYERDDKRAVLGVIDPMQQLGASGGLVEIAQEIGQKLARVAEKLDA